MTSTDDMTPADQARFGHPNKGAMPPRIQAPEGSDLAAAAAAEHDADARVDRAIEATEAARQNYREASAAYDLASEEQEAAVTAALAARTAHIAAMRAAGVAQTADGYVTR